MKLGVPVSTDGKEVVFHQASLQVTLFRWLEKSNSLFRQFVSR